MADLAIKISADDNGAIRILDETGKALTRIGDAGQEANRGMTEAQAGWVAAAAKLDILSKAVNAVEWAWNKMTEPIRRGADFSEMSVKMGVSVEMLSKLELAATSSGASLGELGMGLKFLQRNIAEAASGSKSAIEGLALSGVKAGDAIKQGTKGTEEALLKIADAVSKAPAGAKQFEIAMGGVGRAAYGLIPMFAGGRQELEFWMKVSQDLGLQLDTKTSKQLDTFTDSMNAVKLAGLGVGTQLAIGLAPTLAKIGTIALDLARNMGIANGQLQNFGNELGGYIETFLRQALHGIAEFARTVADSGLAAAVGDYFQKMFAGLGKVMEASAKFLASVFVQAFGESIKFTDPGTGRGLSDFFKNFWNKIAPDFDAKAKSLREQAQNMMTGAVSGLAKLGTGPEGDYLRSFADKVDRAAGALGRIGPPTREEAEALEYFNRAGNGAAGAAGKVDDAVKKSIDTLKEAVAKSQEYNKVLLERVAAGDSLSKAEEAAQIAAEKAAEITKLGTKATEEQKKEILALVDAKYEAIDAQKLYESLFKYEEETVQIQQQVLAIEGWIAAGKSKIEIEKELLILKEKQRLEQEGLDSATAEAEAKDRIYWQTRLKTATDAYQNLGKQGINVAQSLRDAFGQTMDGIIAGTRDLSTIWEGLALSMGKQLLEGLLWGKQKFDSSFIINMSDLAGLAGDIFGSIFGEGTGSVVAALLGGRGGGSGLLGGVLNLLGGGGTGGSILSLLGLGGGGGPSTGGTLLSGAGTSAAVRGLQWIGNNLGWGANFGSSGAQAGFTGAEGYTGTVPVWANGINYFGAGLSIAGGGYSAFNLARSIRSGDAAGMAMSSLGAAVAPYLTYLYSSVYGAIIAVIVEAILFIVGWFTDHMPTQGTLDRAAMMKSFRDIPTFKELEKSIGAPWFGAGATGGQAPWNPAYGPSKEALDLYGSSAAGAYGFSTIFAQTMFGESARDRVITNANQLGTAMLAWFAKMGLEGKAAADEMNKQLFGAFKDLGIDLPKALDILNKAADSFFANWKPDEFFPEGPAIDMGRAVRGVAQVFETELPKGVHVASIAMRELSKDGELLFKDLTQAQKDHLVELLNEGETFDQAMGELMKAGFRIDTEKFKTDVQDISNSAKFLGDNISQIFSADTIQGGIDNLMNTLRSQISDAVMQSGLSKLFDTTAIAESFQPVFALLRRIDEFDLTTATGAKEFRDLMLQAVLAGKANLEEYIPQLKAIADAADLVDKAIEEATKPGPLERFFDYIAQKTEEAGQMLTNTFATAVQDGLTAGFADATAPNFEAGLAAFQESFRKHVYEGVLQGIIQAVAEGAIFQDEKFKQLIAEGETLWRSFTDPSSEGGTAITPGEQARLDEWAGRLKSYTDTLINSLGGFFQGIFNQWAFFIGESTGVVPSPPGGSGGRTVTGGRAPTRTPIGTPGSGRIGFAAGGTVEMGSVVVVGENGPELLTVSSAGVTVTPLDQASRIGLGHEGPRAPIGGGPGTGGGVRGPIGGGPGDTIHYPPGFGPGAGTPPRVPSPGYSGRPVFDTSTLGDLKLSIASAFDAYLKSGDWEKFKEDLSSELDSQMLDGIKKVFLESGPIKAATDHWSSQLASATARAMKDGVISPEEQAALEQMAKDAKAGIETAVDGVRPALDALGEVFGDSVANDVADGILSGASEAINTFAQGGSRQTLIDTLRRNAYEGMLAGMIDAILKADVLKEWADKIRKATSDALEDGIISPEEAAALAQMGRDASDAIAKAAEDSQPAFDALAEGFGITLAEQAQQVRDVFGNAVSSAFALDEKGAHKGFADFKQALKNAVFEHIRDGMLDAFMQSAGIQSVMAPFLALISSIFDQIINKEITIAEGAKAIMDATAAFLGLLDSPEFKAAWDAVNEALGRIQTQLGYTGNQVEQAAGAFNDAAGAASDACTGECDLQYKLATTRLGIGAMLSESRAADVSVDYWKPMATGGIVFRPTKVLAGERGPEAIIPVRADSGGGSAEVMRLREDVKALAQAVRDVAARPVNVYVNDKQVAEAVVDNLERQSRGRRTLARVR